MKMKDTRGGTQQGWGGSKSPQMVDQNLILSSQTLALSPPQTTRISHTGRDRLGLPLGAEMEVFRKPHKAAEYCKQLLFQPTT
jgi:hypothetical protein